MFCLNDILLANRKASREEEMIRCGKVFSGRRMLHYYENINWKRMKTVSADEEADPKGIF